jgi:hypothetical protein
MKIDKRIWNSLGAWRLLCLVAALMLGVHAQGETLILPVGDITLSIPVTTAFGGIGVYVNSQPATSCVAGVGAVATPKFDSSLPTLSSFPGCGNSCVDGVCGNFLYTISGLTPNTPYLLQVTYNPPSDSSLGSCAVAGVSSWGVTIQGPPGQDIQQPFSIYLNCNGYVPPPPSPPSPPPGVPPLFPPGDPTCYIGTSTPCICSFDGCFPSGPPVCSDC